MKEDKDIKKFPTISIITCTYNGGEIIKNFLKGIFSQDYPLQKIELLLADGGSKDKTVDIIQKYKKKYPKIIKFYHNYSQYSDGRGKGYDLFSRKATKEILCFLDQDNILIQKDWLKNMVKILIKNKELVGVQSRMIVPEKGTLIDKYLNAIGIEDPFAIHYSLNSQIILNPRKFKYNEEYDYYIYRVDTQNFYYGGGNGFMIRRNAFFNSGGWNQDIDLFYRMGMNHYKVAVPKNVRLYHQSSTDLWSFIKKRGFYVQYYLSQNYQGRDFYWFDSKKNTFRQNFRFIKAVLFNLSIIPGILQSFKMLFREKKSYWLIHPFMLFSITSSYILVKLFVLLSGKLENPK